MTKQDAAAIVSLIQRSIDSPHIRGRFEVLEKRSASHAAQVDAQGRHIAVLEQRIGELERKVARHGR